MMQNEGTVDRAVRAVIGLALIGAGIYYKAWWGAIGVVPLATAALGVCPAYLPFGINTCGTKPARKG